MFPQRKIIPLIITLILIQSAPLFGQEKTNIQTQNEELGKVQWYRNYEEAVAVAKKRKQSHCNLISRSSWMCDLSKLWT